MSKTVGILQSNYIPWKGYFDLIHDVDEFIFLDDVQFTRQDWRNRNCLKTKDGPRWLTIPVGTHQRRRICDVVLPTNGWAESHWNRLQSSYARAPHFERYRSALESIYLRQRWRLLSDLNQHLIATIADWLGIETRFRDSRDLASEGQREDRVLDLLVKAGADVYVSGPAARNYLNPQRFADAAIELRWKDYGGYPEYTQLHPPFNHQVTVLDLL